MVVLVAAVVAVGAFFLIKRKRGTGKSLATGSTLELVSANPPPVPQAQPRAGKTALPPGWTQEFDEQSNTPYFFHPETGTTQWDRPVVNNVN